MANEKRLIDGNALINLLKPLEKYSEIFKKIFLIIQNCPAVDAVEVCRCKDCRSCKKHPTSDKVKMCTNENWNTEYYPLVHDNDFCSYGERRE